MKDTKIEWAHHTINLWWGCTKVSPGCAHCYADDLSKRFGKDVWGKGKEREDHRKNAIKAALKLDAEAAAAGTRYRVFSASMSDWLDDEVPTEWLIDLLQLIHETPNLDWMLLTKRPERWADRMAECDRWSRLQNDGAVVSSNYAYFWMRSDYPPENVWVGTSVEDQERAESRIPALLKIPAKVRFLSCEPLLEPVYLDLGSPRHRTAESYHAEIHWVIVGGESGPNARPFNPDWARWLRDQCAVSLSARFFMKQMGGKRKPFPEIPADLMIREFPVGKEGA